MRSLRRGFGGLRGSVGGWSEVGGFLVLCFYQILEAEMEREGYELVIYNVIDYFGYREQGSLPL